LGGNIGYEKPCYRIYQIYCGPLRGRDSTLGDGQILMAHHKAIGGQGPIVRAPGVTKGASYRAIGVGKSLSGRATGG